MSNHDASQNLRALLRAPPCPGQAFSATQGVPRMKSSLAVAALENAVRSRHPGETVVHSDHDSPLELPDSSGQGRCVRGHAATESFFSLREKRPEPSALARKAGPPAGNHNLDPVNLPPPATATMQFAARVGIEPSPRPPTPIKGQPTASPTSQVNTPRSLQKAVGRHPGHSWKDPQFVQTGKDPCGRLGLKSSRDRLMMSLSVLTMCIARCPPKVHGPSPLHINGSPSSVPTTKIFGR